jgi:oligopeptide/dipeptide ABC transporter ATP-binding protein
LRHRVHPYTSALVLKVLVPDPAVKHDKVAVKGETQSALDISSGCRFHPRCPDAEEVCKAKEPELLLVDRDRYSACHLGGTSW